MRTCKIWSIAIAAAAFAAPLLVGAQQSQPSSKDAPPPPRIEKLEEGQAPEVIIREPKSEPGVTEKRAPDGTVTEVKVRTGKSTYVVKPNARIGSALPGDAQSPVTRAAQWEILEFNKNRKKKPNSKVDALPAAPPPPAVTTPSSSANK